MEEWITWEMVFAFLGMLTVIAGFIFGVIKIRPKHEEVSESAIRTEMTELRVMINNLQLRINELKEHQEKIDDNVIKEIEKLELRIEKIMDLIIEQLTR